MTSGVVVFTSIAANYLPKARVLAHSVKKNAPHVRFYLMLVDEYPETSDWSQEPFDARLSLHDLGLDNPQSWSFGHSVVELCTAVKGYATQKLLSDPSIDKVFYFDPDMAVFGRFAELEAGLDETSILLTPHQSDPEVSVEAIMDNEMASLKHGVFNMGFFGVRDTPAGCQFASWWSERLGSFCRDDLSRGLFTDQKWANLIPCFFEDYRVLRSPAFNVATWNISTRRVTGSLERGITVNGEPLGFYHFSGFDSGDQALMLEKYGAHSSALQELRAWYIAECEQNGQGAEGSGVYGYAHYVDGEPIRAIHRRLYRDRLDLQRAFPNPYLREPQGGYLGWFRANSGYSEEEQPVFVFDDQAPVGFTLAEMARWLKRRSALSGNVLKRVGLRALALIIGVLAGIVSVVT